MASIDLIRASNGSGDAVKATVTNARVISSTTLQIDATTNWPNKFIATVGDVDGTGAFIPATVTVFNGILSGGNIEITSFAPGYTDIGNTPGQVVVLKPTTAWANEVADTLAVAHNDNGTLKANSVPSTALATNASWRVISITDVAGAASKTILWGYRQHVRITLERIVANATHLLYCYLVDGSGSHSAFDGNVLRSRFGLNGSGTMVTDYASSVNAQVSLPSMTTYQAASGTLMYTGSDGANHMLLGTLGSENASIQTVHGSFWVSGGAVRGISVETSAGTLNSGRVIIEALEN